jgi:nucleotide-binding universal stress UspA family protein
MKILLATDGSDYATRAAKYVVKYLTLIGEQADIALAHVDPALMRRVAEAFGPEGVVRYHEANAQLAMKSARRVLTRAHLPFGELALVGDPGVSIARAAKAARCDLIVMGSHGRTGWTSLFLGSVVSKVLALSKIPVLVVR